MRILKRVTRSVKDAYWEVVHDCLVDLFGLPTADAQVLCNDRRAHVEFVPRKLRSNIFYHREPLDVAETLAQQSRSGGPMLNLADPQTRAAYEAILARHGLA